MIQTQCSTCGYEIKASDELAGKVVRCRRCNELVRIPAPAVYDAEDEHEKAPSVTVHVAAAPADGDAKAVNALGVASFVFGLLALLVCWVPCVNAIILPFVLIGAVLGFCGLLVSTIGKKSGFGWPLAGLSMNVGAWLIAFLINSLLFGAAALVKPSVDAARDASRKAKAQHGAKAKQDEQSPPAVEN